jgi:HK97 family phage major capsid protein
MPDIQPSEALVEKRQQFSEKSAFLKDVMELARDGDARNFAKQNVREKLSVATPEEAVDRVKKLNVELDTLAGQLEGLEMDEVDRAIKSRETARATPLRGPQFHPANSDTEKKSWGQLFVESKEFRESRSSGRDFPFQMEVGFKTLFETAAGFPIENVRSGVLVEKATRPIQVVDMIPSFPITQAAFVYMEETTRTHAAAERAEGTAYPESTFVWTAKTSPVQKIADSIPVTDEQLEDEPQTRSLLEQRLGFGLRQRFDQQVLIGNGTSPNLRGVNSVVGIQTRAKGADPGIVAFAKALNDVRVTGRANPSGAVFHPNDWLDILLTQTVNGEYLFGNPFQGPGPTTLFGVPVAQSDAQTENTGLVGDWGNFSRIDDRRGVQVQTGYVGTQFTDGKITLRADFRVAFTVTRPAAFLQLTGI